MPTGIYPRKKLPKRPQPPLSERHAGIIAAYKAGEKVRAIAERFGVDPSDIYTICHRRKVRLRHQRDESRQQVFYQAFLSGLKQKQIAAKYGVAIHVVAYAVSKLSKANRRSAS